VSKIPKLQRRGLNALLWQRISEVLAEQGLAYSDLWKKVVRDKNTHTNWRNLKTELRITDLEEVAKALNVSPAELLRPSTGEPTPKRSEQLELPFEPGRKGVRIELEYTPEGFILLRSRTASA
jgi:hypothetical protein